MAFLVKAVPTPTAGQPERPEHEKSDYRLNISVVFTSVSGTLAALRSAGNLANRLGARITLIVPQIVPYPGPLESPPVLLDFSERRFREIAMESPVDVTVHFYLCRERRDALATALQPRSLVVIGGRRRWWPTAEERLARELGRAGHEVVFAME
jgi:hypothetical protein